MKTQVKFVNSSLVSVVNSSIVVKDSTGEEHTFTNASVVSVNNGTIILETEWKPKRGELVKNICEGGIRYGIFKEITGNNYKLWTYGCSMGSLSEFPDEFDCPKFRFYNAALNLSPVTLEEQKEFDDFCKSQGKIWNKEILQWEKYKWEPKRGEQYYYIDTMGAISYTTYNTASLDPLRIKFGNCFPTREQAQKAAEGKRWNPVTMQIEKLRWKPTRGTTYFHIIMDIGEIRVDDYVWENDDIDIAHYDTGNCFKTEEEAEAKLEQIKKILVNG